MKMVNHNTPMYVLTMTINNDNDLYQNVQEMWATKNEGVVRA